MDASFLAFTQTAIKFLFYNFIVLSFLKNITPDAVTDQELVDRYRRSGDLEVLAQLYQRYMDLVYGVCLKYFSDTETAKDAVMQIFEELIIKLKKHEVKNFRGWLHQVAKNHCLMQLRTPRNLKTIELPGDLMHLEENVHLNGVLEKEENFRKLDQCLGELAGDQQTTIRLFYLEGKCYNEIAEITGMDRNQVRSFIQNGRRNLKICMERAAGKEQVK